jgi:hypothetical protein
MKQAKASFVARERGKFAPPKPDGRCLVVKHFPDFREATSATCESFYKYEWMIVSASAA